MSGQIQILTDRAGRTLGIITECHGIFTLKDKNGLTTGTYDATSNTTKDANGRTVGTGDLLSSLHRMTTIYSKKIYVQSPERFSEQLELLMHNHHELYTWPDGDKPTSSFDSDGDVFYPYGLDEFILSKRDSVFGPTKLYPTGLDEFKSKRGSVYASRLIHEALSEFSALISKNNFPTQLISILFSKYRLNSFFINSYFLNINLHLILKAVPTTPFKLKIATANISSSTNPCSPTKLCAAYQYAIHKIFGFGNTPKRPCSLFALIADGRKDLSVHDLATDLFELVETNFSEYRRNDPTSGEIGVHKFLGYASDCSLDDSVKITIITFEPTTISV